jgi:hypothetical protein
LQRLLNVRCGREARLIAACAVCLLHKSVIVRQSV